MHIYKEAKSQRFYTRGYVAATGRRTCKDPIGFNCGVSNLYEYCVNDPVNCIDVEGLQSDQWEKLKYVINILNDLYTSYDIIKNNKSTIEYYSNLKYNENIDHELMRYDTELKKIDALVQYGGTPTMYNLEEAMNYLDVIKKNLEKKYPETCQTKKWMVQMSKQMGLYGGRLLILGILSIGIFVNSSGCTKYKNEIIIKSLRPNYNRLIEGIIDNNYNKDENIRKIDSLNNCISKNPYSNLFIERGFYYINISKIEDSKNDFMLVLAADSNNVYANLGMAFYFSKRFKFKESQAYVNKVIETDTLNSLAYYLKSGNQKEVTQALIDIDKSIYLSRTFINNRIKRAMLYYSIDSLTKATEDINYAISQNPYNPDLYIVRLLINEKKSNYEGQIDDFTKLIKINPESELSCLFERAKIFEKLGEYKKELIDLKKIESLYKNESSEEYFNISGLYARLGKTDSCLIYAKKAIEKGGKTKADFEKDSLFAKVIKKKEFQEYLRR